MTNPTKETHRYVGMWRPPFEVAIHNAEEASKTCQGVSPNCPCGCRLWEYDSQFNTIYTLRGIAMDHWIRGHFDEPVYEPIQGTKQ